MLELARSLLANSFRGCRYYVFSYIEALRTHRTAAHADCALLWRHAEKRVVLGLSSICLGESRNAARIKMISGQARISGEA